jgi:hypothetical protein
VSDQASATTRTPSAPTTYSFIVEFDAVDPFLSAVEKVRDAGFTRWDAHTPFVVHGLDDAMGIKPNILPYLVFGGGLTGTLAGIGLQWWTNAVDYPFLISGKPYFSLPANIPIAFEMTILFAALTSLIGMLALNGLPRLHHPLFTSRRFRRVTNDRFFISVEAADPKFDDRATPEFLSSLGGLAIERVEEEAE